MNFIDPASKSKTFDVIGKPLIIVLPAVPAPTENVFYFLFYFIPPSSNVISYR